MTTITRSRPNASIRLYMTATLGVAMALWAATEPSRRRSEFIRIADCHQRESELCREASGLYPLCLTMADPSAEEARFRERNRVLRETRPGHIYLLGLHHSDVSRAYLRAARRFWPIYPPIPPEPFRFDHAELEGLARSNELERMREMSNIDFGRLTRERQALNDRANGSH